MVRLGNKVMPLIPEKLVNRSNLVILMEYYDPQGILSSYIYPAFYTKPVSMMEYGKVN